MLKIYWLIVVCLVLSGCKTSGSYNPRPSGDSINDIIVAAATIETITESAPEVVAQTTIIKTEAKRVDKNVNELTAEFNKVNDDLQKERDSAKKYYNKILTLIVIASGLGCSILAVLFFTGHIKSTLGLLTLAGLFGGAITLLKLSEWFVYIAAGYGITLLGTIIYLGVKYQRSQKANREVVATVEKIKPKIDTKAFNSIANKTQSKSTKKIVDTAQRKINDIRFSKRRKPRGFRKILSDWKVS